MIMMYNMYTTNFFTKLNKKKNQMGRREGEGRGGKGREGEGEGYTSKGRRGVSV